MDRLQRIRKMEAQSHTDVYSSHELYQPGSWMAKPVKTVMDVLPLFEDRTNLRILDLGCGTGRNAIAIAESFRNCKCLIDCVDILPLAIEKLMRNADNYDVSASIHGIVQSLEAYSITPKTYDLILAVSALEHVDCESTFIQKLAEIRDGVRDDGIVCLIINSNVREYDKQTGLPVPAQFEVNLPSHQLQQLLEQIFGGWDVLRSGFREQRYNIPRDETICDLHTSVITYVARKQEV